MDEMNVDAPGNETVDLMTGTTATAQSMMVEQAPEKDASVQEVEKAPEDTSGEQKSKSLPTAADSSVQEVPLTTAQPSSAVGTPATAAVSRGEAAEPSVQEILDDSVGQLLQQTAMEDDKNDFPGSHMETEARMVAQTITTGGKASVQEIADNSAREPTGETAMEDGKSVLQESPMEMVAQTLTTASRPSVEEVPDDPAGQPLHQTMIADKEPALHESTMETEAQMVAQTITTDGKREQREAFAGYETDSVEEVLVDNPEVTPIGMPEKESRPSAPESPAAVHMAALSPVDAEADAAQTAKESHGAGVDDALAEPVSMTDVANASKPIMGVDEAKSVGADDDVEVVDDVEAVKGNESANAQISEKAVNTAEENRNNDAFPIATGQALNAVNAMSSDRAENSTENVNNMDKIKDADAADVNIQNDDADPMDADDAVDAIKPSDASATAVSSASDQSSELSAESLTESFHGIGRTAAAAASSASRSTSSPADGTVVWARVKKWPWWPGVVVPFASTLFFRRSASRRRAIAGRVPVQFFCDGNIGQVQPENIRPIEPSAGMIDYDSPVANEIQHAYAAARDWAARFGPEGPLPFVARRPAGEEDEGEAKEREMREELAEIRRRRAQVASEASALRHELKVMARRAEPVGVEEGADSSEEVGDE